MSNLKDFFKLLEELKKNTQKEIIDIDNKIKKLNTDISELEKSLEDHNKFIRKQRAVVYDYEIKNYDMDYIEHSIRSIAGFNYEIAAYRPLNAELNAILKKYKSKKRGLNSMLKDIFKLCECFNETAFLVKPFDNSSFKIIQNIISQMDTKIAANTLKFLNIYNTKLIAKSNRREIEERKKENLGKIVGASRSVQENVVVPLVKEDKVNIINSEIVLNAQDIITNNQEMIKIITEEEKECYQLIIETKEYIFNLAITSMSNLKVAILVLTYLVNEALLSGLTNNLEQNINDVINSYNELKELAKKEEEERKLKLEEDKKRKLTEDEELNKEKIIIEQMIEEEKEFLDSLAKYEQAFAENNKLFDVDDWNYIEALNAMNASFYLESENNESYQQCLTLLSASNNLTVFNYLSFNKLSQILKLKDSIKLITQSSNLSLVISTLKTLVDDYEQFLKKEKNYKINEKNIEKHNNLVVFCMDDKNTLIEDFLYNDKASAKNISTSHINGIAYMIKVLKDNTLDFIRKNSTKAKGDNLENNEMRIYTSGNIRVAFKITNKQYEGKMVPIILIVSVGIKLGDDKNFFDYIDNLNIKDKIDSFENTLLNTMFDGRKLEDIKQILTMQENNLINNLKKYVDNGHKIPNNLTV
ncbi:MAG: hypothetical protein IJO33_01935 [Bacilli bacterium]|nr:hypothetical protein [Bacilli bacterium]